MIKTLIQTVLTGIAIICAVAADGYTQADTAKFHETDDLSLKELLKVKITTASKTSQALEQAPATVIVITKEQIKIRGYRSLLDVMFDLPDMKVDDKAYSVSRTSTVLRGIQGQDKFLILLDGVRISSPTSDVLPIMENYPVNLAEQIEIVYGPASALYGADAVAGVINIISKKSADRKNMSVDASSMIGTFGYTNNTLFIAKKLSDHVNLVVSGQYSYDQGPDYSKIYSSDTLLSTAANSTGTFNTIYGPMTPKEPVKPGYEAPMKAYNIYAALHADDFSFTLFRNYARTPSTWENNPDNTVYNKDVFLDQYMTMANASYKKTFNTFSSSTSLTGSEFYLDPESSYRNLYTGMERAYKYATGSMIKAEQQIDWKANRNLNLTGGMSYEKHYSIPWSADLDEPVDPNNYAHDSYLGTDSYYRPGGLPAQFYANTFSNTGAYLQVQYFPVSKLNFTLGARNEYNSRYGNTFNPRLGIVYKPFNKTTVKALYGSAFLAPAASEAYAQWGSFDTPDSGKTYHSYWLHLPNPDIKPITSQNLELSVNQFLADNVNVTLDGYFSEITNLHAAADDNESTHLYNNMFNGIPVDYIEVFINQGRQVNYGGSLQLNLKHSFAGIKMNSYIAAGYINGSVNSANTESEETSPDAEIEFISHIMIHAGIDMKAGKFSFSPRLIFMNHQHLTGIADTINNVLERQSIPGYALLNVSLRYNVVKRFSVFANIYNALNQEYRSSAMGIDLNDKNTPRYYGQHEDPIRIMGGFNFTF